jgi:Na+-driven multidrug efflux pump
MLVLAVITADTQSFSEAFSGISLVTRNSGATTSACNIFKGEQKNDCKNGYRHKRLLEGEARLFSAPENQSDNQLFPSETNSDADSPDTETDTGRTILALAIPALAAMLVDPLLTIADTAFVGRYSESPYELAGMGSASALLTFSFYVFNFLCTATTPLVASKRASGDEAGALAVGGQAVSLALGLGTIISVALILLQGPLLGLMGAGGNEYASDFLTIRALAAPAVFCISASTGILRGYLDTKTPIFVLFLANVLNFGLDVALITVARFGPKGAAIATTTAEWISAILFLLVLAGKLPSADGELGKKDTASVEPTKSDALAPTIVPSLSIPPWTEVEPLIVASSSIFFRSLVLQLFLTTAAALVTREGVGGGIASTTTNNSESISISISDKGASFISAHQIAFQIWMLCSYISDALAAASQGLVADAIGREAPTDVRDISKTVFVYSSYLGVLLAGVLFVGFYPTDFLVNFFTSDEGTQRALLEIAALLVVSQPLNSLVFAADGVLQGASEFPYQAKSMALSGLVGSAIFVGLQSTGLVDNLFGVWAALIGLQMMRGITSAVKIVDENGPINLLAEPSSSSSAVAQVQER